MVAFCRSLPPPVKTEGGVLFRHFASPRVLLNTHTPKNVVLLGKKREESNPNRARGVAFGTLAARRTYEAHASARVARTRAPHAGEDDAAVLALQQQRPQLAHLPRPLRRRRGEAIWRAAHDGAGAGGDEEERQHELHRVLARGRVRGLVAAGGRSGWWQGRRRRRGWLRFR